MKLAYFLQCLPLVAPLVTATATVCTKGINSVLAPLSAYPPAQTYCQSEYPRSTVTATSTSTIIVGPILGRLGKREALPTIAAKTAMPSSPETTAVAAVHDKAKRTDPKAALLSSLSKQAGAVVSTLCSCINPPATITTTSNLVVACGPDYVGQVCNGIADYDSCQSRDNGGYGCANI